MNDAPKHEYPPPGKEGLYFRIDPLGVKYITAVFTSHGSGDILYRTRDGEVHDVVNDGAWAGGPLTPDTVVMHFLNERKALEAQDPTRVDALRNLQHANNTIERLRREVSERNEAANTSARLMVKFATKAHNASDPLFQLTEYAVASALFTPQWAEENL